MKLAYTICEQPGQTDRTLAALAEALISRGMAVAGVVQTNSKQCDQHLCDMDVRVLPDGAVYRISQSLGKEARGCRLDPGALEQAVGAVSATLGRAPELLIINKFGKHEADGRGFRPLIADALARDIPVVLGVSKLSLPAFLDFAGEVAEFVEPDVEALLNWVEAQCAASQKACA
ncbi:MAG: DUF2478 domain-containing protein [Paracoccaceae bacterium]